MPKTLQILLSNAFLIKKQANDKFNLISDNFGY